MKKSLLGACLLLFVATSVLRAQETAVSAQQKELSDEFQVKYDWMHKQVLNSFFRFKLSDACWTKMMDEEANPNGIQKVNFSINQVTEYLKRQGYGDLSDLNSTNRIEELANRPKMKRIVEAAQPNFSLTIDGTAYKACNDENWRLLLSYMTSVTEFIGFDMPIWKPRGGKADISLVVSPTAKKFTVGINPEATKFTITAPMEEVNEWSYTLKNGFQKGAK